MFDSAELSRAGGRAENQDAVGSSRVGRCHCWVLADGLGGHRGGAVAARLAVETAIAAFEADAEVSAAAVQRCVEAANTAVVAGQQADPALSRMRATLVLLVAGRRHVVWGHVGDARLYRLEAGRLSHRTRDHSVSPSLRERRDDIPALAYHFLSRYSVKIGKRVQHIPAPEMRALQDYPWPGNIRELQNIVERAVILSSGHNLDLSQAFRGVTAREVPPAEDPQTLRANEAQFLRKTLDACEWRIQGPDGAAARLDIAASSLRSRMKRLGITRR